jgi:hypothetical protein
LFSCYLLLCLSKPNLKYSNHIILPRSILFELLNKQFLWRRSYLPLLLLDDFSIVARTSLGGEGFELGSSRGKIENLFIFFKKSFL